MDAPVRERVRTLFREADLAKCLPRIAATAMLTLTMPMSVAAQNTSVQQSPTANSSASFRATGIRNFVFRSLGNNVICEYLGTTSGPSACALVNPTDFSVTVLPNNTLDPHQYPEEKVKQLALVAYGQYSRSHDDATAPSAVAHAATTPSYGSDSKDSDVREIDSKVLGMKAYQVVVSPTMPLRFAVVITADGTAAAVSPLQPDGSAMDTVKAYHMTASKHFWRDVTKSLMSPALNVYDQDPMKSAWRFESIHGLLLTETNGSQYSLIIRAMVAANDVIKSRKPSFSGLKDIGWLNTYVPQVDR